MIYDIGDGVPLRHEVRSVAGVLTNATVSLTVTAPDGGTSTPSITNTSTGVYDATVVPDETGLWTYVWAITGTVTDNSYGQFTVGDPGPPSYVTLTQLKSALGITDTDRDANLLRAIVASSRYVEGYTHRRFYADQEVSTRSYLARGRVVLAEEGEDLLVDDIADSAGLVVAVGSGSSFTTLASTAYETLPDNALARIQPITAIRRLLARWSTGAGARVRVTARWGWPAVPEDVQQACLIQAARLWKRKDSPEGVLGSVEWGSIRVGRTDPDVMGLLAPYRTPTIG